MLTTLRWVFASRARARWRPCYPGVVLVRARLAASSSACACFNVFTPSKLWGGFEWRNPSVRREGCTFGARRSMSVGGSSTRVSKERRGEWSIHPTMSSGEWPRKTLGYMMPEEKLAELVALST